MDGRAVALTCFVPGSSTMGTPPRDFLLGKLEMRVVISRPTGGLLPLYQNQSCPTLFCLLGQLCGTQGGVNRCCRLLSGK